MYRPRVIPCLLLDHEKLVKTIQFDKAKYIGDAMNAVKIFNEAEADEIIFLDILASEENRPFNFDLIRNISDEAYMPVGVGGGLDSLEKIRLAFKAGAEKVVINSAFLDNPKLVTQAAEVFGSQAVVVSVDLKQDGGRGYHVYAERGKRKVEADFIEILRQAETLGAGEVFINHIDLEGTMEGYDQQLISLASNAINIPLIACGGAGEYEHLKEATDAGASAAAAGSLFVFMGSRDAILINYPDHDDMIDIFG